jgi:hypothetical protein
VAAAAGDGVDAGDRDVAVVQEVVEAERLGARGVEERGR